ncbi:MAG: glycerol-3-phosphate 1-O-acyltransferase PlsY [Fibrobacter intestinalis]|uniref:glycerol-3-phosphate 1-O-acyltransferase PlsY n=1 Tax=Fibrobacter intestinalis TaxID=28122 RepID=UPI003F0DDFA1
MNSLLSLPIAYLLGAIPTAIWVAKIVNGKDYDIRDFGSKNSGLTNTFRVLGVKPALPVVVVDLLKGFFAPTIALWMNEASKANGGSDFFWLPLVCGILAILGHSFTCFAGFRGGKGVLTAFGVFLAIAPVTALLSFAVWLVLTLSTKYVSVGSIGACIALAGLSLFGYLEPDLYPHDKIHTGILAVAWLVAVFVIFKHKANIRRLLNGTENGFGKKRKKV